MTATAAMVQRLRRMVSEPDSTTYAHDDLAEIIEEYPVLDSEGLSQADADWTPTYDLNAAAAVVWTEKAGSLATAFDFGADGANYARSQQHAQALKMQRYYNARRRLGTITMIREVTDDVMLDDE